MEATKKMFFVFLLLRAFKQHFDFQYLQDNEEELMVTT